MADDIQAIYAAIQARVCAWAADRPDVHAVVLVGSRARSNHAADRFSDLDLILLVDDPVPLVVSRDWLSGFGPVWAAYLDQTGEGEPEWLVLFQGGAKADFVLHAMPATPDGPADLQQALAAIPYGDVVGRGMHVLVDKTASALGGRVSLPDIPALAHPDEAAFTALTERFMVQAVRAARLVYRGDIWRAKFAVDGELKTTLLSLLEWHARARRGLQHDTWYGGRFIGEWADPQAFALLPAAFAALETADLQRALFATLSLFTRLACETAASLGFADPGLRLDEFTRWMTGAIGHE